MCGTAIRVLVAAVLLAAGTRPALAQETVDRIVARVENDIVLWSDIRTLSRYQQFVDGKSETDGEILRRLIDQWIVRTEVDVAHFPHPSDADVDRGLQRLLKSFPSPAEYEARKKSIGLSDAEIRGMVASQLYFNNYLDSRFRPGVLVDAKAIEEFYQTGIVPVAKARGQEPPSLEAARDAIQEALVQRGINEQADRWLKESRLRLHIEKLLDEGAK
jgi:hypothetical protein